MSLWATNPDMPYSSRASCNAAAKSRSAAKCEITIATFPFAKRRVNALRTSLVELKSDVLPKLNQLPVGCAFEHLQYVSGFASAPRIRRR